MTLLLYKFITAPYTLYTRVYSYFSPANREPVYTPTVPSSNATNIPIKELDKSPTLEKEVLVSCEQSQNLQVQIVAKDVHIRGLNQQIITLQQQLQAKQEYIITLKNKSVETKVECEKLREEAIKLNDGLIQQGKNIDNQFNKRINNEGWRSPKSVENLQKEVEDHRQIVAQKGKDILNIKEKIQEMFNHDIDTSTRIAQYLNTLNNSLITIQKENITYLHLRQEIVQKEYQLKEAQETQQSLLNKLNYRTTNQFQPMKEQYDNKQNIGHMENWGDNILRYDSELNDLHISWDQCKIRMDKEVHQFTQTHTDLIQYLNLTYNSKLNYYAKILDPNPSSSSNPYTAVSQESKKHQLALQETLTSLQERSPRLYKKLVNVNPYEKSSTQSIPRSQSLPQMKQETLKVTTPKGVHPKKVAPSTSIEIPLVQSSKSFNKAIIPYIPKGKFTTTNTTTTSTTSSSTESKDSSAEVVD